MTDTADTNVDVDALLASAKPRERTVTLYLRDLSGEIEDLDTRLGELQRPGMLTTAPGARALAEQIQTLQGEMEASALPLRLRAMDRDTWRALLAKHPPRKDGVGQVIDDDAAGVNTDTFYPALARLSIIAPVLSDEQWAKLTKAVSPRQFDELWSTAWHLNRGDADVPFSRAASRTLQNSAAE